MTFMNSTISSGDEGVKTSKRRSKSGASKISQDKPKAQGKASIVMKKQKKTPKTS
jgi:hypothetical protein